MSIAMHVGLCISGPTAQSGSASSASKEISLMSLLITSHLCPALQTHHNPNNTLITPPALPAAGARHL